MSASMAAIPDPSAATRKAIEASYLAGVLTEEEYNNKIQQLVPIGATTNTAASTRMVCGQVCGQVEWAVFDRASWFTLSSHQTYQDALQYLKSGSHGQVKWAKSTGKPDDRRFVCNMHEGCQRAYRICGDPTGESEIQEYMGIAHSGLPKEKKRKNSVLTYDQTAEAEGMLLDGIFCIMHVSCMYQYVSDCIVSESTSTPTPTYRNVSEMYQLVSCLYHVVSHSIARI